MLCGGTESAINQVGIAGFGAMRALSRRNGDRRIDRNRADGRAIRAKYLNEIRAAIRHVNFPVGSAVAVFPEGDQWAAGLGAGVSAGKFADGENLLSLRIKYQQARRWRS